MKEPMKFETAMLIMAAFIAMALLVGCKTTEPQGTRVEFREVVKEVQRPCVVKKPVRPSKLARPLPADVARKLDLVTAKLKEWDGAGGYGDRADAAIEVCTKP